MVNGIPKNGRRCHAAGGVSCSTIGRLDEVNVERFAAILHADELVPWRLVLVQLAQCRDRRLPAKRKSGSAAASAASGM